MQTKQFTVGNGDGPIPGQTIFKADFLKNVFVDYLIVDNINESQLLPTPNFTHNYVEGVIDRMSNPWVIGNKLIVVYSECKCK